MNHLIGLGTRHAAGALVVMFFLTSCNGFDEQLNYNEAQRAHNKRDFDKAIRLYQQLLEGDPQNKVHPDNAIIHYDLGVAYLDIGEREKARRQADALKRMNREDLAEQLSKLLVLSDSL